MPENKLTNHQMLAIAMDGYSGEILSTLEIKEIVVAKFPYFSLGSLLPNDHSNVGNKKPCWCAKTDNRIFERISHAQYMVVYEKSVADDINEIQNSPERETTKEALINARIGQGEFRKQVIKYWNCCAVTRLPLVSVLKASHIKPWKSSNNIERLDSFNGLLLSPNLDALFDLGYISFNNDGIILISSLIANHTAKLGINAEMFISKLSSKHLKYLEFHRASIYKG